ncbi:transporter substrate-binding domain-containing protein [Pseudomonas gingeri]|uniref:Transporter substrate-binding domain-containing protein n=1 Tax=Pseudomonas gingeri TaxID=117681 RepID=A0A7Y8CNB6_9PSED|nr:transporter substrate-binding domain-containing protein [Pseudomonas gingeri]NWB31267.1 transporter substrate-binding domain-containing protein [Pseudomonas gingeri]NWC35869.1 transporter substrate-binding domain-containing protein [Pseudomonas gingeri]NWD06252.1 transporter substrate-binding domain-containing protein [Pseudomonas gingeri]NWD50350.1 transporter substrate-binding domain-containing protein [Pseudomonas gingeri]NWE32910.1 transporter substrate-binding domain-containing protein
MQFTRTPIQRFLPVVLGAVLAFGAAGAAQADATLDKIQQRHKLVVGVLLSGGPFGSIDPATQDPKGLNVDLANALGKDLDVAVELVAVLPANRVQFLQQGKVDLLIANMEWTAERDTLLGHVPTPFYKVGGTAAVPKESKITRWEDLKGQPVCTSQGSSYVKPLTELGADLKAFKSSSESLLALRGNNCVAAVHDATLINPLLAGNPEWKDYRALTPELNPAPSVIWTRLGETDTQKRLDGVVQGLHRSGWLIEAESRNHITPASPALVELHNQFKG